MATISEYSRRQLASSAVGTPGVDTSGQQLGNSIAQTAGSVANAALSLAAQRQEAVDKASAFERSLAYQDSAYTIKEQHAKEYAYSNEKPEKIAGILRDKLSESRSSMADALQSDGEKQLFLRESGQVLSSSYRDELKRAGENQVVLAGDKLVSANNKIANSVYSIFSSDRLTYDQKLRALQGKEDLRLENVKNSAAILGPEKALKFNKDTAKANVIAATLGLLETNPIEGLKLLKDGTIKDILGPEEHEKRLGEMQKRALNFKDVLKQRQFEAVLETNSNDIAQYANGEHNLATIQNIKNEKTRKFLTEAYISDRQLTASEIVEREAQLFMKWEDFFQRDRNGKLTYDLKKDKKVEDVVKLQYEYMASFGVTGSRAELEKQARDYPDMLRQAIKNGQPNPFVKAFISAVNVFGSVTGSKSKKDADKGKAEMAGDFYKKLQKINPDDPAQLAAAVQATLDNYQVKANPNMSKYKVGETYTVAGRTFKAVKNPNGSIGLEELK